LNARAEALERGAGRCVADRLAGGFVLVLLGLGSLVLWIGIPAGGMWLFGELTRSTKDHFLLSLYAGMLAALVALFIWFFFFAQNPLVW
jgi:hypothetical protein